MATAPPLSSTEFLCALVHAAVGGAAETGNAQVTATATSTALTTAWSLGGFADSAGDDTLAGERVHGTLPGSEALALLQRSMRLPEAA